MKTKLYNGIKTFRNLGFGVYSLAFMVIMFNARIDYQTLVKFNVFGEGLFEYILAIVWVWSIFIVYIIDKYEVKK